jgi:crotonobetainyl-CoA:carnitine CoA-transferase CaiB-like acyl-CoA transferase
MLSDMGAQVIRIERKGHVAFTEPKFDVMMRNRRSVSINLRKPEGVTEKISQ